MEHIPQLQLQLLQLQLLLLLHLLLVLQPPLPDLLQLGLLALRSLGSLWQKQIKASSVFCYHGNTS